MNIGDRIRKRREELGLSVDDLARRLGKHRATIYRYERKDIVNLPVDVLAPLSRALHTTPADLMGWEDSPATAYPAAQELNEQEATLIELFRALAPAEKDEAVEYLRYLKDRDELEQLRLDLQAALAAQKGAAER